MNKKGFTLLELLAVIVILAIIAIIATPIVLDTLRDSRKQAFLDDAKLLERAANNYYSESQLATSETSLPLLVTYDKKKATNCNGKVGLSYSGQNPYSGNIYINDDGTVEMKIFDNGSNMCAVKTISDKNITLQKISQSECKITGKTC